MASRKSDLWDGPIRIVASVIFLGGLALWTKTHNAFIAFVWMGVVALALLGLLLIYAKNRHLRLLASGIGTVDTMSGEEFESFLKAHFEHLGYRAETTPTSGDYGADLIATRDTVKYVIQAKRWKRPVGIEAVQQVVGAIKHYGATDAIVITNSSFTDAAKNLAQTNEVELWDREKLLTVMAEVAGRERAGEVMFPMPTVAADICPRCSGTLVERNGKRGVFFGCSSYPKCRYTRDV